MQASKLDIFIIGIIFIFVFSLMFWGCGSNNPVSDHEMYEKCVSVNEEDSDEYGQTFTIYQ